MEKAIGLIKDNPYTSHKNCWIKIKKHIDRTISYKKIKEIILLPESVQTSYSEYTTISIAIGIVGWTIWTLADQIRDENINVNEDLYVYSMLRPVIDMLILDLQLPTEHLQHIYELINIMEYANSDSCTYTLETKSILKSIGAAIPMLALLGKMNAGEKNIGLCYNYFYHLIGARQLSDDAIDWPHDMKNKSPTLVTKWLEEMAGKDKSDKEYREAFDSIVSPKVAHRISWYTRKSIGYVQQMTCFKSTEPLEKLPRFYEDMATKLIAKRKDKKLKNKISKIKSTERIGT